MNRYGYTAQIVAAVIGAVIGLMLALAGMRLFATLLIVTDIF